MRSGVVWCAGQQEWWANMWTDEAVVRVRAAEVKELHASERQIETDRRAQTEINIPHIIAHNNLTRSLL